MSDDKHLVGSVVFEPAPHAAAPSTPGHTFTGSTAFIADIAALKARITDLEARMAAVTTERDEALRVYQLQLTLLTRAALQHNELQARADAYDGVLRDLASYVGNGGYNSEGLIDPEQARGKIRDGIDTITRVEGQRREATENRWRLAMRRLSEQFGDGLAVHKADIEQLIGELRNVKPSKENNP